MRRHVAFLRGINLGNRRVKMDRLRRHAEAFGLENVHTYMASGNVIFDHPGSGLAGLERELERHLEDALGFTTEVFVRPLSRLEELVRLDLVADAPDDGYNAHVVLLREAAGAATEERLMTMETPDDGFRVLGREVVWLRRGGLTDSSISHRDLEEAVGGTENTMRNLNTIQRLVRKYGD